MTYELHTMGDILNGKPVQVKSFEDDNYEDVFSDEELNELRGTFRIPEDSSERGR